MYRGRHAIRIGISKDNCLAYLDFLCYEENLVHPMKPLVEVGQVRLPLAFRFSGLGSYCTPWLLDTNDHLLQAVPQTDLAKFFIDSAWISFVAELNKVRNELLKSQVSSLKP